MGSPAEAKRPAAERTPGGYGECQLARGPAVWGLPEDPRSAVVARVAAIVAAIRAPVVTVLDHRSGTDHCGASHDRAPTKHPGLPTRPLPSGIYGSLLVVVLGLDCGERRLGGDPAVGHTDDEGEAPEAGHSRLRELGGMVVGGVIWLATWVFPVTLMIAMAWGCESHTRQLGRRLLVFYDGEAASAEEAIARADKRQDKGHDRRAVLRAGALASR
jgi:hypothetical protein